MWGEKGRRRKRLPESLLAPSNVHGGTPWVPTRAQPWNSNLTATLQTLVWWEPSEGVTLITCKSRPREHGAPRQTAEKGALGRREGGNLSVVFACRCWREERGSYKLHQLGKTPGLNGEGWSPTSRAEVGSLGTHSQTVEQLRERRAVAPATNAQVYKVKTVSRGWSWGLPAQKRWERDSISQT